MKRMNVKRKLFTYIVIWSVFLSSLLLYSPETNVLSASGVPEITMNTPDEGAVLDVSTVEFTGKVSSDSTTPEQLTIKVFEQLGDSEQPKDITLDGKLSIKPEDKKADFSYSRNFSEGAHTLTFFVTDKDGVSNSIDQSFTVKSAVPERKMIAESAAINETVTPSQPSTNEESSASKPGAIQTFIEEIGNRPYMAKMYLAPKGSEKLYDPANEKKDWTKNGFLPAEDMTRVPVGYQIVIDIRSDASLSSTQPLITFFGEQGKDGEKGKEKLINTFDISYDIKSFVYTFKPETQLSHRTTYYVYLNPNIANDSGKIIPRFLKFTTISPEHQDERDFSTEPGMKLADIPDHKRPLDFNIHGNYSNVTNACQYCHSTHNGKNESLEGGTFGNEENLCMTCHDGTSGSQIGPKVVEHKETLKTNQHNQNSSSSCTSCHNPHTQGTLENPNSFKPVSTTDSHIRTYKKASTAGGKADEFSLCLSCHRGNAVEKGDKPASDINQYYSKPHINESLHNIKATEDSGSTLNGQLPCAECHETHGSNNSKMLREELGNVKLKAEDKFKTTGSTWSDSDERKFCISCHNGSTVIYGKTGKLSEKDAAGDPITGHQKEDKQGCSFCHGGTSKSAKEAAHAPKEAAQ
ncbi:cytochrome c3 family protein [Neobacillus novalis]|uniref:Cytochrome c3 family protein n=1 Tax=Neobacillus novalis TaxID=220687 RepID=A0AA95MK67_9BACI|nr:cytochrome c3 family protein [Neobacillus novalis]WHY85417.1 cytochrome c3 family protein [Neobacillus novalis]